MAKIQIVEIFRQSAEIARITASGWQDNTVPIELIIIGRYIPTESVLILTSSCGSYKAYYPEEIKKQLESTTVYVESLSEASRRCIKFADRSFTELKKLFNPEVESTQKQSGSPYR